MHSFVSPSLQIGIPKHLEGAKIFRSLDPNTQCITAISPMIFIVFAVSNIICELLSKSISPLLFRKLFLLRYLTWSMDNANSSLHPPLLFIAPTTPTNASSNLGPLLRIQSRRHNSLHLRSSNHRNRLHGRHNPRKHLVCPGSRRRHYRRLLSCPARPSKASQRRGIQSTK